VAPLFAGVDAGGTSFKLAVGTGDGRVLKQDRVLTTSPDATVAASLGLLGDMAAAVGGPLRGIGIASFGPLNLNHASSDYGMILRTPKAGWEGCNLKRLFGEAGGVPVAIDIDVAAALLGESRYGAARGAASAAYVTVGTGIGAHVEVHGQGITAAHHSELGHIRIARHKDDPFEGTCPFHGDCLEGLVSGPALEARAGPLEHLPAEHPVWAIAAHGLAQLCLHLSLTFRLQRIVLGGGVMQAPRLLALVRRFYDELLGEYLAEPVPTQELIKPAALGENAGTIGAIELVRGLIGNEA
jgi:fructokinase